MIHKIVILSSISQLFLHCLQLLKLQKRSPSWFTGAGLF